MELSLMLMIVALIIAGFALAAIVFNSGESTLVRRLRPLRIPTERGRTRRSR